MSSSRGSRYMNLLFHFLYCSIRICHVGLVYSRSITSITTHIERSLMIPSSNAGVDQMIPTFSLRPANIYCTILPSHT